MPENVTRADVARLAGVSPSVVSFTLNGGPRPVAAATAARVRAAVAQLGYTPNALARALSRGSADAIGLLVHDITDPFCAQVAAEMQRKVESRGQELLVSSALGSEDRVSLCLRRLDAARPIGIVTTAPIPADATAEVARLQTRIVQLGSVSAVPGVASLAPRGDDVDRALTHLFDLGHRSIAFLAGSPGESARWTDRGELQQSRGEVMSLVVADSRSGGCHGLRQMLAAHQPTAVVASSGLIAVGALHAIIETGRRVPDDISLLALDDIAELEFTSPPLTALRHPVADMVDAVVNAFCEAGSAIADHRYQTELMLRSSTATLCAAAV